MHFEAESVASIRGRSGGRPTPHSEKGLFKINLTRVSAGLVPRWIGTVAGRIDPPSQGFAEMAPLSRMLHAYLYAQ